MNFAAASISVTFCKASPLTFQFLSPNSLTREEVIWALGEGGERRGEEEGRGGEGRGGGERRGGERRGGEEGSKEGRGEKGREEGRKEGRGGRRRG